MLRASWQCGWDAISSKASASSQPNSTMSTSPRQGRCWTAMMKPISYERLRPWMRQSRDYMATRSCLCSGWLRPSGAETSWRYWLEEMQWMPEVLQYLVQSIRGAAVHNPDVQAAPRCILWPDGDRQWEAAAARLQSEL